MKSINGTGRRIAFNSPLILSFSLVCILVQALNTLTGDLLNDLITTVGYHSLHQPLAYLNVFLHVLGHFGWEHLFSNLMYILLLGPMLEEKYGAGKLAVVFAVTAFLTGVVKLILFPNMVMCGASGIVFALIILTSITGYENNSIPLTFILVAILYIGQEVYSALLVRDSIAQSAHVLGGAAGAFFGFRFNNRKTT